MANVLRDGVGLPLGSLGDAFDYYLDTASKKLYKRLTTAQVYTLLVDFAAAGAQGPQGAPGMPGIAGAPGAPGPVGAAGPTGAVALNLSHVWREEGLWFSLANGKLWRGTYGGKQAALTPQESPQREGRAMVWTEIPQDFMPYVST